MTKIQTNPHDATLNDAAARRLMQCLMDVPPHGEDLLPPPLPSLSPSGYQLVGLWQQLHRRHFDPPDGPVRRELQFYSTKEDVFFGWIRSMTARAELRIVEVVDVDGVRTPCPMDAADLGGFFDLGNPTEKTPCVIVVEWARDYFEKPPFASFALWGLSRSALEAHVYPGALLDPLKDPKR